MAQIPYITVTAENGATIPEDILRNLHMVFATRKGEQALDRTFGISWDAVDKPPREAERIIRLDVMEQVKRADLRCAPVSVNFDYDDALKAMMGVRVVIALL